MLLRNEEVILDGHTTPRVCTTNTGFSLNTGAGPHGPMPWITARPSSRKCGVPV